MLTKNILPKVLICDDDKNIHLAIKATLSSEFDFKSAYNGDEAVVILKSQNFDLVLMDMEMRHGTEGLDTIPRLLEIQNDLDIIFFSGRTEFEYVRRAMQAGALDYVPKDSGANELRHIFKKTLALRSLKIKNEKSQRELKRAFHATSLIGSSEAVVRLKKLIEKARLSKAPVLISGETGTGKEVVAKLLRKEHPDGSLEPFIAVDSSTIQSSVAESVLFGYEKGAFTGAEKSTSGLFEEADGGVIYFDELANMPLEIQNKLLRVIQEKEVLRIGSSKPIELDFRVVSATNKNLEELIEQGKFKDDLFQRLNVIHLKIPPLRERKEDIPELLQYFSETLNQGQPKITFLPETIDIIQNYPFPGNVRELQNLVIYLYSMLDETEVNPLDLPPKFFAAAEKVQHAPLQSTSVNDLLQTQNFYEAVKNFEYYFLQNTYKKLGENISKMAEELGMDRSYLHNKLKAFKIHSGKK